MAGFPFAWAGLMEVLIASPHLSVRSFTFLCDPFSQGAPNKQVKPAAGSVLSLSHVSGGAAEGAVCWCHNSGQGIVASQAARAGCDV